MARYGRDYEHRNWLDRAGDAVERWFGGGRGDYDRDFRGRGNMDRGRFEHDEGIGGRGYGMVDRWNASRGGYDREYGGSDYRGGYGSGYRGGEMGRGGMDRGFGGGMDRGMSGGMQGGMGRGYGGGMGGRGSWQGDSYRSTNRDMDRDWGAGGRDDRPGYGGEYSDVDYGRNRQSQAFRGEMGRYYGGMDRGMNRDRWSGMQRPDMDRDDRGTADTGMRGTGGGYGDYDPYPGVGRYRGGGAGGVPTGRYFTGYGGTNQRSGSGYEPLG